MGTMAVLVLVVSPLLYMIFLLTLLGGSLRLNTALITTVLLRLHLLYISILRDHPRGSTIILLRILLLRLLLSPPPLLLLLSLLLPLLLALLLLSAPHANLTRLLTYSLALTPLPLLYHHLSPLLPLLPHPLLLPSLLLLPLLLLPFRLLRLALPPLLLSLYLPPLRNLLPC